MVFLLGNGEWSYGCGSVMTRGSGFVVGQRESGRITSGFVGGWLRVGDGGMWLPMAAQPPGDRSMGRYPGLLIVLPALIFLPGKGNRTGADPAFTRRDERSFASQGESRRLGSTETIKY